MRIRLIRPWGLSKVDDIIDPPVGVAAELIKAGRAIPEVEDVYRDTAPIAETWNKKLQQPRTRARRK